MKKETYIHIPEPCHEDWNKMTTVERGRYCQSCCKTVVDFTLMTDREILSFLSKSKGNTCGNFAPDQLNRAIVEPATPAKKKLWAVMLSFLLPLMVWNKVNGQKAKIGKIAVVKKEKLEELRGDVIAVFCYPMMKPVMIEGRITDSLDHPISGASITLKGSSIGVTADSNGVYKLSAPYTKDKILVISSVGFFEKEVPVSDYRIRDNIQVNVVLKETVLMLKEVSVVSVNYSVKGGFSVGGFSVVRKCKKTNTKKIIDTIINVIKPTIFKIYPNPISIGQLVTLEIKQKGDYQVSLVDNNSRLLKVQTLSITSKNQSTQLELPNTISIGIYYVLVTDEKTKKQFTQKLIIQ